MEVATFVDNVSQFEPGESKSMCVAFSAAQIICMVAPGQTNTSGPEDIDQLADQIYGSVTGSITEENPISVDKLEGILRDYSISFEEISTDTNSIDAALASGCPLLVMAPESSYHYLNGNSPYNWDTSPYNHCIVLSGLSDNGGYEVRDGANNSANPPIYQKQIADLFSAIKVIPTWMGGHTPVRSYGPNSSDFNNWFTVDDDGNWICKVTNAVIIGGNKALFSQLSIDGNTLPVIGLPLENEQYHVESDNYQWSTQRFERATMVYDPANRFDKQSGLGTSYLLHINPGA